MHVVPTIGLAVQCSSIRDLRGVGAHTVNGDKLGLCLCYQIVHEGATVWQGKAHAQKAE